MIIHLLAAALLSQQVQTIPGPPIPPGATVSYRPIQPTEAALTPQQEALIAPVTEAIAAERAAQAALPPPSGDREKLERMGRLDQAARAALDEVDLSNLPAAERETVSRTMWARIQAVDRENQEALLALLPPEGWFMPARYGDEAATAAFLIVQHGMPDLWRRFLPVLEPLAVSGQVPGQHYAMMFDRLSMMEGRPQRYGTQARCVAGRWSTGEVEDAATIDARRAEMGIPISLADYQASLAARPACG